MDAATLARNEGVLHLTQCLRPSKLQKPCHTKQLCGTGAHASRQRKPDNDSCAACTCLRIRGTEKRRKIRLTSGKDECANVFAVDVKPRLRVRRRRAAPEGGTSAQQHARH